MPLEFRRGFVAFVLLGAAWSASFAPAAATAQDRAAYVIGSLDASVARVDLDDGTVELGVATTGAVPNRIETTGDLAFGFVVCSTADRVDVLDLATDTITGSIPLPAGSNPWTCEVVGDRLFVSGLLSDRVYEIDPWGAVVLDEIEVGVAPEGMCAVNGTLYVANTGFDFDTFTYGIGTVSAIDLATNTVVQTIPVDTNPQECLALPDGSVHVICTGDFFLTTGSALILDPVTNTIDDTIPLAAYPGTAVASQAGLVFLGVTTTSFGSEIWAYDAGTHVVVHDGSNPILPSLDFYGNPRIAQTGHLLVPNFAQDLLMAVDPSDPGGVPQAFVVGDGAVDLAVVERESPVPIVLSGLRAASETDGVRLAWNTTPESGIVACVVERADPGRAFTRVADDLPAERESSWLDRSAPRGRALVYRVGGEDVRGDIVWLPAVTLTHGADRAPVVLAQALPNPFRASTTLRFAAAAGTRAAFEIVDVAGRRVLAQDLGTLAGASTDWIWDGRDGGGRQVAPGAYFVRARLGTREVVTRLLRVR